MLSLLTVKYSQIPDVHSTSSLMTVRTNIWCKFCVQSVVKETPQIFSNAHILSSTFRDSLMCKRYDYNHSYFYSDWVRFILRFDLLCHSASLSPPCSSINVLSSKLIHIQTLNSYLSICLTSSLLHPALVRTLFLDQRHLAFQWIPILCFRAKSYWHEETNRCNWIMSSRSYKRTYCWRYKRQHERSLITSV